MRTRNHRTRLVRPCSQILLNTAPSSPTPTAATTSTSAQVHQQVCDLVRLPSSAAGQTASEEITEPEHAGRRHINLRESPRWHSASTVARQVTDPKEHKWLRERECFTNMTDEERWERNRKSREARQKKKDMQTLPRIAADNDSTVNLDNVRLAGSNDWLHRNDSYISDKLDQDMITQGMGRRTPQVDWTPCDANLTDVQPDGNKSSSAYTQINDPKEGRWQRDWERNAKMTDETKYEAIV
ncbi:hypothetical protein ACP70R_048465 [Stipagrostis hirtigluma subsp. patula]